MASMRDESAVRERPAVDGPASDVVHVLSGEWVDASDGPSGVNER